MSVGRGGEGEQTYIDEPNLLDERASVVRVASRRTRVSRFAGVSPRNLGSGPSGQCTIARRAPSSLALGAADFGCRAGLERLLVGCGGDDGGAETEGGEDGELHG